MLVHQVVRDGRPHGRPISTFDLDFQPELPPGALRGSPRKCAPFCNYCNSPKYFYQDHDHKCVQCDSHFTFSAAEQMHWFEVIKVHIRTRCLRCPSCRKVRKTEKALQRQLQLALDQSRAEPQNAWLHVEVARAIVENKDRTGRGDLQKAIAHARRGRSSTEPNPQSLFWEGRAHELAGRDERAKECWQQFLRQCRGRQDCVELQEQAQEKLA